MLPVRGCGQTVEVVENRSLSAFAAPLSEASSARDERTAATHHLSRDTGATRTIAIGRVILAAYWVLAFVLDPPTSPSGNRVALALIYAYAAYAVVRAVQAWRSRYANGSRRWLMLRHLGDLAVFVALGLLTHGANNPFFLGLVFSLVCATLLFNLRGMLWTAAGALVCFIAITYMTRGTSEFTLYRFIVRTGFFAAIAALLVQLKIYEERLQNDYRRLADWPRGAIVNLSAMIGEVLQHAAALLRVPRLMVIWEDSVEPVLHIAVASRGSVSLTHEPLHAFDPVVDRSARLKSFVAAPWLEPAARSESREEGLQRLSANPLHPALRERFRIEHVIASRFSGESLSGWVLALDKEDLTEDDLILTDIVAGLIESRLEQFYLAETVRDNAVAEERLRFARDLHDGILQSLSGTALHLQCLRHLIENDVRAALFSLTEVQEALAADQREVRSFIMKLRSAMEPDDEPRLGARLTSLGQRIQREWGLKVSVETTPLIEIVGPGMAEEIYRVVKEALTNAAIHSNASRVWVEVHIRNERVRISIEDNGRGFAFSGRFDLKDLIEMKRGPVTLKERVIAVGGNLVIDSKPGRVRIDIDLPTSLISAAFAQ